MRVRKKLNIFISFSALFATSLAATAAFIVGSKFLAQRTQQAFQMETYFTLRELDRIFFERSSDIEILSRTLFTVAEAKRYDHLESVLFTLRDYTKVYQNLVYVDENFIRQVDTNRIGLRQKVNWPQLFKAQKQNRIVFDFFEDPETNMRVISFAKHLLNKKGQGVGYLVCNVPFTTVSRVTRLSQENSLFKLKNRVELLRDDGEIVYSTYRKDLSDVQLAAKVKENLQPGSEFKFLQEDHRLLSFGRGRSFYTLSNMNWYLVMSTNENEVNQPLKGAIFVLVFLLSMGAFVFWFIISNISRALVRPLESAAVAVEKFGHGELKALADVETPEDDLGALLKNLKRMGEQIQDLMTQRAQKARVSVLGEIAGNIAHEINNPLQVISIRLELIEKNLLQGEVDKIKPNVEIANQTVFRISKIVKGLKALSREGDADPFAPVAASEILDNVLVLCQGTLKQNLVNIEARTLTPSLKVECRAVQITQVLLNLVSNACDAVKDLPGERWVELNVKTAGAFVEFQVRNSGPRIAENVVKKIFDPFYTTKRAGEGTGLGLSISLKIAKEHMGTLSVDLTDQRTCFVLKIPLKSHMDL
jgi:C4-dicarboxylate-specific signal transduction histidine kinase